MIAAPAIGYFTPPQPTGLGVLYGAPSNSECCTGASIFYGAPQPGGQPHGSYELVGNAPTWGDRFNPILPSAGLSGRKRRVCNGPIGTKPRARAVELTQSQVHLVVVSLDYKGTSNPLTCTIDGNNIVALAKLCGVSDITQLYNEQATTDNVKSVVRQVGSRCASNDYFVFFYSGHGTSIADHNGDEIDGEDEAFVLCDSRTGQAIPPTGDSLMSDDELVDLLARALKPSVKVLVISDCCHSGTICDFKKDCWRQRKAISISGCRDTQTSGDTGNGGICTHALLMAIEQLQRKGVTGYNVGTIFRETVMIDDSVFHSPQDITIDCAPGYAQSDMLWPFIPKAQYTAPYQGHNSSLPQHTPQAQSQATTTPHYQYSGQCSGQSVPVVNYTHQPLQSAPYTPPPPYFHPGPSYVPSHSSHVPLYVQQPYVQPSPSFVFPSTGSYRPSVHPAASTHVNSYAVNPPPLFAQAMFQPSPLPFGHFVYPN